MSSSTLSACLLILVTCGWTTLALAEPKPGSKTGSEHKQSASKERPAKPEQTIELLEWLGSFEENELTELDEAMDAIEKRPNMVKTRPATAPESATYKQHKITGVQP